MITNKQLEEWRELYQNATVGPWYAGSTTVFAETAFGSMELINEGGGSTVNDLEFIAEARTAVPLLIREVVRLRKALDGVNRCETCRYYFPDRDDTCALILTECNESGWKPKE